MAGSWALLKIGCAECGDWPLVAPLGVYATSTEAAAAAGQGEVWKDHPQGGFISQTGSGAFWISPLSALAVVSDNGLMSEYDAPRERAYP